MIMIIKNKSKSLFSINSNVLIAANFGYAKIDNPML